MRRDGSNILVSMNDWKDAGLSFDVYRNDKQRGQLQTANVGGNGRTVEIIWSSIREDRKRAIIAKFGNPEELSRASELERYIVEDVQVKTFFTNYELPTGEKLGHKNYDTVIQYYNNAIVLAAAGRMAAAMKGKRKSLGGMQGGIWEIVADAVNAPELRDKYSHEIPINPRRLREKYELYKKDGLKIFVHKSFGNSYARKVEEGLERLILSIYCMDNKPYASWVHEDYMTFLAGRIDIVDLQTGELFDRADFYDEKKGDYVYISESTCWNYINNPANRAIVDSVRNPDKFHSNDAPHYLRKNPYHSFSLLSMDDVNLPQLLKENTRNGENKARKHVMAYYPKLDFSVNNYVLTSILKALKISDCFFEISLRKGSKSGI